MNFITCISCLLLKGCETRLPQTVHCSDTFPKQKACAEGRVEAGLEEAGKDSVRVSALCLCLGLSGLKTSVLVNGTTRGDRKSVG